MYRSHDVAPVCHRCLRQVALGLAIAGTICIWPAFSAGGQPVDTSGQVHLARGVCVVLGDPGLEVALPLASQSEVRVYVQLPDDASVEAARAKAAAAGVYGRRLFIERGDDAHLHLGDNMADLLIANKDRATVPEAEALRVLRPRGKALLGEKQLAKPFPQGIDDWSHPYHGPDNNPQSTDRVARAPYLTQFLADPRYAPLPQVAVASAGRVFKAYGHIAFKVREEPLLNTLVAYNGYNGTILWTRPLTPGIMIHRNTMIATDDILYVGDDRSCKMIDTATGRTMDEIVPPVDVAGGTFWKWMALDDGVLYALIGAEEQRDPIIRQKRAAHGWPWTPLSPGFNQKQNPWGFGRNLLAIDPKTKEVLWSYHEQQPIDSRSLCLKDGRLFFFRFDSYLGCLDTKTGKLRWRRTAKKDPQLFATIGTNLNRQDWRTNWRTTAYMKCSDKALYVAGPMFDKLLVLSAEDGSVLWQNAYDNYQLVLRDGGLYAISGPWGNVFSKKFDPLTGRDLGDLPIGRRACTRPTGSIDAVFFRAQGGSVRLDAASGLPQWVSPMRAQCQDGVTIANGLLYWWASVCDCQLTLYGNTCLGPAGRFEFAAEAKTAERLETGRAGDPQAVAPWPATDADWPTFRGDNRGQALSKAAIAESSKVRWLRRPETAFVPTAPVAVGDLIFLGGSDGVVRALDAKTGSPKWTAFTGGSIRIAPTVWQGRVFVGSGDGWVYAFEARGGRQLWRFRAAPTTRKMPVYGQLLSTWPVASGVLVDKGIAYVAAGIANYDGTYVYALDARSGTIRWQNTSSGHLDPEARTGVSVQGHMLLDQNKLYLAGGTSVSPAVYDIADGKCLNDPSQLRQCQSVYPRGWELSIIGDHVVACGQPFYKHPDYLVFDPSAIEKIFHVPAGTRDVVWVSNRRIQCYHPIDKQVLNRSLAARKSGFMIPSWGKLKLRQQPIWQVDCPDSRAMAVCANAVVVAEDNAIEALDLADGSRLWRLSLPAPPVTWGMAVDRQGDAVVTLRDGCVVCVGPE